MLASAVSAGQIVASAVDLESNTREGFVRQQLGRCAATRFELDCSPVRSFPSFRGQRNYPGLWWFATTGAHVGHESWVERDQLMALDADPDVIGVLSQPFWIHWPDGTRHAPDYFVRRRDGSVVVVDVREDDRISEADREVFERSAATCGTVGWDYCRVGALDPVLRANLRWLSGYRHPRVLRMRLADRLAEVFARSGPLMAGVLVVGTPLVVLPVLYHLLWHGRLVADLCGATLADDTQIALGTGW